MSSFRTKSGDIMKVRKAVSTVVDVLMYLLLLLQMLYVFTGNNVHEFLGMGFFACIVAHLIIKRKLLLSLFKFKGKSVTRVISNIVTILLTAVSVVLAVSSMGVSRTIFPKFRYVGSVNLHIYLATTVLTLAVLHGGLKWIMRTKKKKRVTALVAFSCAGSIAIGLALVPYLNRHFKVVRINYAEKVHGEKVDWAGSKPLIVYFTRLGNTDFDDDVDAVSGASLLLADGELMGSNQLIAEMIDDAIDCDVKPITITGDRYPSSYSSTVSAAGKELKKDARPSIEPIDISGYNSIILVYPLWWGTVPTPVATFLESADFRGKDLYLIATQGSSGYGDSVDDIEDMAKGAEIHKVMSIYCEDIPDARGRIGDWLKELNT